MTAAPKIRIERGSALIPRVISSKTVSAERVIERKKARNTSPVL